MANVDRPHGFDPYGVIRDLEPFDQSAASATAIFIGDLVSWVADTGTIEPATAAGVVTVGASNAYSAALTAGTVNVYGDPNQRFVGQTAGTTPALSLLGDAVDHVAGAGSTTTFISGHEIDNSAVTAADVGLLLIDFLQAPDNDWSAAHAEMICVINSHSHKSAAAGV